MTFFCVKFATRILRVIGRQSIRLYDTSHTTVTTVLDRHKIQDSGPSNK